MNEPSLVTPRLAPGVRLQRDKVRGRDVLLYPEGALVLNETATAVLELCDGQRTVDDIAEELRARYGTDVRDDVRNLLQAIAERGLVDGE